MMELKYCYAVIEKNSSQTIQTNNGHWNLNNDTHYSIVVNPTCAEEYPGKYYYNSQWWERHWNEVDEHGLPIEESGYTDVLMTMTN